MTELVPYVEGRPAVVHVQGVTLYLSIHDSAYLAEKARWKQRLAAAHPDRHQTPRVQTYQQTVPVRSRVRDESGKFVGACAPSEEGEVRTITRRRLYAASKAYQFRKLSASYRQWRKTEWKWYAAHGLTPPDRSA